MVWHLRQNDPTNLFTQSVGHGTTAWAQAESMWETQLRAADQTYWLTRPDKGKVSDVSKALALGAKKPSNQEECYFNAIF